MGALAAAVFLALAADEAGYPPTVWYPSAIFVVVLAALALPRLARLPSRAAAVAIALLLAFTIWCFLSIAWSDVKGDAWDGANRTLLYLVVFALFALLPWRPGTIAAVLGAWSVGVAAIGAVFLARATDAADPGAYFLIGRFAEPAGYQNANCALFLMAFFPAVFLAARQEVPAALRAVELAAAGVLLELALLTQSRTSLIALPVTLVVYLVLVSARVRAVAFLVPPAVAAALASGRLLDVFPAIREDGDVQAALTSASRAIWITAAALFLVGLAAALLDRRLTVPARAVRTIGRTLAAAAALAIVVGGVAAVAGSGDVPGRLDRAWDEFRAPPPALPTGSYFSSGLGGNRYDIWRVALDEFREAPLHGVGVDNFSVDYLRDRRSDEEPLYPHSVFLRIASQTGIVGALLFAGFLVAALRAVLPLLRRCSFVRGVGASAVAVFVYWLAHGSVDWFWEIPGLATPAMASLGAAASLANVPGEPVARPRRGVLGFSAALFAVVAVLTLTPPWLSAKEVQAGAGSWRTDSASAFDHLERARNLNPLSDNPDLVAGAIASRLDDRVRMRSAFERAVERNPYNWYAYFELAVAAALEGRRAEALRLLAHARSLDPREPAITLVEADVRAGKPVSPEGLDQLFLRRTDPEYRLEGRD